MRILLIGLLVLACGQPQAGKVYSGESQAPEMVLGLAKNNSDTYELRLCQDGVTGKCVNPLVTADGEAYSFDIRGRSWLGHGLRWGAGLLAAVFGGAVVFKVGRNFFVRKGVVADLGRELNMLELQETLTKQGQELPEELQLALRRGRLNNKDSRTLLTLLDQHNGDLTQEATILKAWNEHVTKLQNTLKQGEVFVFNQEFNSNLANLRSVLESSPSQREMLVELDQLTEALRRNKISKKKALSKFSSLEKRMQQKAGKLVVKDWDKEMQQARKALEKGSEAFDGQPAVKKGLQEMRAPLAKLKQDKSTRRLQRLSKSGTRRAEDMMQEIDTVYNKIEALRTKNLRAAAVRTDTTGKLDHRYELLKVLRNLELAARKNKKNFKAGKLKRLAKSIERGKVSQSEIAKRMRGIDRKWQEVKDLDSDDAWARGLGEVDAILTADRSIDDYRQLLAALRQLQHQLQEIGDQGSAKRIRKLERKTARRLRGKRSVSSRDLDKFSEKALQIVNRSRKHNKLKKTVEQLERGVEELQGGLADSGLLRPKRGLQRSLSKMDNLLQKLDDKSALNTLRELQADIAAQRLSREEIESRLTALNDMVDGGLGQKLSRWQTSMTQLKAALSNDSKLFELNPDLASIWDDMASTLEQSTVRKTFVAEVDELQRYTLDGKWEEGVLDRKLKKLDEKVRKMGNFRTAGELVAVQGKESRAARKELQRRIAELRRELRAGAKAKVSSLDAAFREGEKARKAKQGRFKWLNYGDGGERVVNREEVLRALRKGNQVDVIEVRMGLEKLAAQLTGATIFVALPLMLANTEGNTTASDEPQELLPLLQRVAQAVDASITPTANCLLGACAAGN